MIFKKFRTLYQAYKNIEAYEDLLQAKGKLKDTNKLISEKEKQIIELNQQYEINKQRATLACLTPEEVLSLQNDKVRISAAYLIERFNQELKESADSGKDHFAFKAYNPDQADIKALKFIAKKLKNEGFGIILGNIEYPPGMYMGPAPWEMSMYVKVSEPSLLNKIVDTFLDKPKKRIIN